MLFSGDYPGGATASHRQLAQTDLRNAVYAMAPSRSGQLHSAFAAPRSATAQSLRHAALKTQSDIRPTTPLRPTRVLRGNQQLRGSLSTSDRLNPLGEGIDLFSDDYRLTRVKAGQQVHVRLSTPDFTPTLQLINARTGRLIRSSGVALTFTVRPGVRYLVRVTSAFTREIGDYRLSTERFTPRSTQQFNFFWGHGLINATAAVARAAGKSEFPDVTNLDGTRWGLDLIKAPEVWAQGFTGQGVTVAVLDEGVDYSHPALSNNIWNNADEIPDNGVDDDRNGFVDDVRGWNFIDNNNDPDDLGGHGTHVAGTIAASKEGLGVTGVAYNARIMPVRVLSSEGGTDDGVAQGIRYAVENGADVINMSLGRFTGGPLSPNVQAALRLARQKGVVVVVAAGNERQALGATRSQKYTTFIGANRLGISVGSVTSRRQVNSFSNPAGNSPSAFFVAPGFDIRSTIPGNSYFYDSGTSMATPHVAGVVALMLSANPDLTPTQIEDILAATADRGLSLVL
ncbi:S8 family serine peptidase [Oscillatoria sp. FACHB-1407]|uniref:S8 family peptidase n=1 Tax=Oscillatoria sp. FACHB-1407 TaxID=2692847 RepID=UPI0016869834|nr:S8 family peptidase [Oscillatoria sp. FACHB-1407]MBD2460803.1 S8 family serine peptidase [Oscillatoria sp. FACHB-1407]